VAVGKSKTGTYIPRGDKTMKRIPIIAFFTLASILGAGNAFAQTQGTAVRVTVPFGFTVGNNQLPAGTYSVIRAKDGTIHILSSNGTHLGLTLASESGSASKGCALIFHSSGGQYFMRGVRCSPAGMSVNFPVSKLERGILAEVATLQQNNAEIPIGSE